MTLRETLRLAAAIADPTAYPVGARVQMHYANNTRLCRGTIIEPTKTIPFTHRTVEWTEIIRLGDDEAWDIADVSTVRVGKLELIGDDE